jgi:membrane-bound lytic murein transglycosylase MltF
MMISLSLLLLVGEKKHVIDGLLAILPSNIAETVKDVNKLEGLLATESFSDDPLIQKIIMAESSGDPNAVSSKGAKGLMQIMDGTAKDPGFGVNPLEDPFDPVENVRFGTEYFNAMLNRYDNDTVSALAAFNWGPGNVDKWRKKGSKFDALPKNIQKYINTILN